MKMIFWSPSPAGRTTRNMSILANVFRIRYGMRVRTFQNYQRASVCMEKASRDTHVFLDCKNHLDASVEQLFLRADTVVINLPQKRDVIASYFQEHHRIQGNIFYLISSSPADPIDSEAMCSRICRLGEEEYGVIPYNLRFEQYYEKKQGFLYQNRLLSRTNYGTEREFEEKTCEIAVKLLKMNCLFK